MRNNLIIIIPVYNEQRSIGLVIRHIFREKENVSILVIDDNSPDGTADEVRKLQGKYDNLYLMVRKRKMGLGGAYIEGFKYAMRRNYDIIVQMDGDLSHSPDYLDTMIGLLEEYDLVIGSRYIKGGGIERWPLFRLLLSRMANFCVKILLGIPVNDLTSGFKCMKRKVLERIDFSTIKAQGYAFQIEMVYRAYRQGLKIVEYPIVFRGREKGKSNMTFGIIIEAFIRLIMLSIHRLIHRKNVVE